MNGSISLADLGNKWRVTRRTLYRWIRDQKLHAFQTPGGQGHIERSKALFSSFLSRRRKSNEEAGNFGML